MTASPAAARTQVLVVEDDPGIADLIVRILADAGHDCTRTETLDEARRVLEDLHPDAVLTDYRLPDGTGFDLLEDLVPAGIPCVLVTQHASIRHAVDAVQKGAHSYVPKPVDPDELRIQVEKAIHYGRLVAENQLHRRLAQGATRADAVVGESRATRDLRRTLRQVARAPARSVLVTGETGTGKGLVARVLHGESERADRPFVSLTCSAVPESLLERELFGHEAGAFTDAREAQMGLLEAAQGGTLFLDEIGDMSLTLQAKLLGVLEDRQFRRLGGQREIPVDLRVVSATHRDLRKAVEAGTFRADLLFRLEVVPIEVPPLRRRRDDIPALARHFVAEMAHECGRGALSLSEAAIERLMAHDWPGNVREFRNALERAVILTASDVLEPRHFAGLPASGSVPTDEAPTEDLDLGRMERRLIQRALDLSHGNQSEAARRLGITRDKLRYRLSRMSSSTGKAT